MFLLVKRRPKGGENFGRQILGGKSTKSTKRQIFGSKKKTIALEKADCDAERYTTLFSTVLCRKSLQ